MQNIKQDIISKDFKRVYLLFGEEQYLVKKYRDSLKTAALGDDTTGMNLNCFTGQQLDMPEFKELLVTLPMFADRRVVMLDSSGLFSKENDLPDCLSEIPDTTVLIMTEENVDKRSRLFRKIKEVGYACEFAALKPEEKLDFVARELGRAGKKIMRETCEYLVNTVGGDLYNLVSETGKLIDYLGREDVVTAEAIREICTPQIENKIFKIVDSLIGHDRNEAMKHYFELIALKESPLLILRVISNQYSRFLTFADLLANGEPDASIASKMHMPDWLVRNTKAQLKGRKKSTFLKAVNLCIRAEEDIKTGAVPEQVGVEILLANLASL